MYANVSCDAALKMEPIRPSLGDNPTIADSLEAQSAVIGDIACALTSILEAMSGPCKLMEDRPDGSKPSVRSMCSDLKENNDRLQYCFRLACAIKDSMGIG